MEIVDSFEKVIKPGLWLVRSRQPIADVSRFVYGIGVELGQPLTVLTFAKKEIQNEVFALIRKDCLDGASDELEYNWLEQELSEYKTHGFQMIIYRMDSFGPITFSLMLTAGCL